MGRKDMHFVQIDPVAWRSPPQKSSRPAILVIGVATAALAMVWGSWQWWLGGW